MSRRTMPYHRRYHGDALQGYRKLSLEQRGAYTTILDLIYDEGGPIERNDRWLAGELNCSLRKAKVLVEELISLRKIYVTPGGKISNHRSETEIENSLKISRKRAESGMKRKDNDGEKPRNHNKNNAAVKQLLDNCAVIPVPVPYKYNNSSSVIEDTGVSETGETAPTAHQSDPTQSRSNPQHRLVHALDHRTGSGAVAAMAASVRSRRGGR